VGEHKVNLAIVAANNRYAGFGPGTANMVRKMIGLEESVWKDRLDVINSGNEILLRRRLHFQTFFG
jgi:hypothetical protein